jgi:hypothetical protein
MVLPNSMQHGTCHLQPAVTCVDIVLPSDMNMCQAVVQIITLCLLYRCVQALMDDDRKIGHTPACWNRNGPDDDACIHFEAPATMHTTWQPPAMTASPIDDYDYNVTCTALSFR